MSATKSGKSKFIHDVKGPAVLTIDVITDIINGRKGVSARKVLAERHGISENRVNSIWKEYYGGTTLKDFESGLKKPIPDVRLRADVDEPHTRKYKSERGVYTARDPKVIDSADAKAKAVRKVAPQRKVKHDLDLDAIAEMDDNDAEIIAGEVTNGNDSAILMSAIAELIDSNKHLSAAAIKSLKQAQLYARKNYKSYDIESETDDDSTAPRLRAHHESDYETISEEGSGSEGYSDPGLQVYNQRQGVSERVHKEYTRQHYNNSPAMVIRENSNLRLARPMEVSEQNGVRSAGHNSRAQPIYRTDRESDICAPGSQQANYVQTAGSKSAVSGAQYNKSQVRVQQDYAHDNNQQYSQPNESVGLSSTGGHRPCKTVPGVPWLAQRK